MVEKKPMTVLIAVLFVLSPAAHADGNRRAAEFVRNEEHQETNEASNASFDKRLPPVLPGEVVNDGHSKTKVWSTSGPVPGSAPPSAPQAPAVKSSAAEAWPGIGSVIVDQRGDKKR